MSSIMVRVESRHRSFWGFLVRLCGIVGGMFATSGKILKSFFTHSCRLPMSYNALLENSFESTLLLLIAILFF